MGYLLAFLGLAALIVLHEFGHFLAAKAVGMRVERFSLFFGPMFVKRRRGETEYGIGVIPLGGYVKITGMTPYEEFESPEIEARAYYNQPVWKRIVVIAAGPGTNIVLAFVIFWVLAMFSWQHFVPTHTVTTVLPKTAATGVLKPGDRIVSVDGVKGSVDQLKAAIVKHHCAGKQVNKCQAATPAQIVVSRDGKLQTLEIRPRYDAQLGVPLVGFEFGRTPVSVGPLTAAGESASYMWLVTSRTISTVANIFNAKDRQQLHGVVGVTYVTQQYIDTSASQAWQLIALISLSLGVINLFPFLPLDGGHIFWAVIEKLRGKRIPFVVMERAGIVGIVLIVGIFLIGLSNDISGLSNGSLNIHSQG